MPTSHVTSSTYAKYRNVKCRNINIYRAKYGLATSYNINAVASATFVEIYKCEM